MTRLTWIREQDGEKPNGSPAYDYRATGKNGAQYHIVWARDHGGMFGYTARTWDGAALTHRDGIIWGRTLSFCQDACNKIEREQPTPPPRLVPNWVGKFSDFDDWVRTATRKLSGKLCESSTCTYYKGGSEGGIPAICVDTKGRRCCQGSDFMRARDEGTFPIRFFWDCKPE